MASEKALVAKVTREADDEGGLQEGDGRREWWAVDDGGGIWTVDDGKNDGKLMMGTDNRNR